MKALKELLNKKRNYIKNISDKDVFYVFKKIIQNEYGNVGTGKIKADFWKEGKLFLHAENSNWASEVFSNRSFIIRKINNELGEDVVKEIKFK